MDSAELVAISMVVKAAVLVLQYIQAQEHVMIVLLVLQEVHMVVMKQIISGLTVVLHVILYLLPQMILIVHAQIQVMHVLLLAVIFHKMVLVFLVQLVTLVAMFVMMVLHINQDVLHVAIQLLIMMHVIQVLQGEITLQMVCA